MTKPCCPGDDNPFSGEPTCRSCGDIAAVSTTRFFRRSDSPEKSDIKPCPSCEGGTRGSRHSSLPLLSTNDLTDGERTQVREWRAQGHHELDALRWVEGTRYRPEDDAEFLAFSGKLLSKWRFRMGRD